MVFKVKHSRSSFAMKKVTKATKAYVKKAVAKDHEKGYLDVLVSNYVTPPSTDASIFYCLNQPIDDAIVDGLPGSCTGLQTKITSFDGVMTFTGGNAISNRIRLMIVYDRQTDGTLATWDDLMSLRSSVSVLAPGARKRFQIVTDKSFTLGGNTSATKDSNYKIISLKKSVKLPATQYYPTGANASITGIRKGSLLMIAFGDNTDAASTVTFGGTLRINYES